jgi:hypothetical protein
VDRAKGKSNLARMMKKNLDTGRKPLHRFERFTFVSDLECYEDGKIWSGFLHFREIDAAYPDTTFLLNTRNKADWLQSRLHHRRYAERFIQAHGLSGIDACLAIWSQDWDRHLADVRQYFADRPADLVEFNIDTDTVHDLIARLPGYDLDAAAWDHLGQTDPENAVQKRAALDAFVAARNSDTPTQ